MSKQKINLNIDMKTVTYAPKHGHQYVCKVLRTGEIYMCEKLPPILKALREITGYTFKVPHGNKVRTLILEDGICIVRNGDDVYEITIDRW